MTGKAGERSNQKRRTRQALLDAAAGLMKEGRAPSLEEVAEEALISRATAYRYFSGTEPLLLEAALDVAFPGADDLFGNDDTGDAATRLKTADSAVHAMISANEIPLRLMIAHALEEQAKGAQENGLLNRQNRRSPLIEEALAPATGDIGAEELKRLSAGLALVIGPEAMIVFRDVLQIDDETARTVRHWMIDALVAAARQK